MFLQIVILQALSMDMKWPKMWQTSNDFITARKANLSLATLSNSNNVIALIDGQPVPVIQNTNTAAASTLKHRRMKMEIAQGLGEDPTVSFYTASNLMKTRALWI